MPELQPQENVRAQKPGARGLKHRDRARIHQKSTGAANFRGSINFGSYPNRKTKSIRCNHTASNTPHHYSRPVKSDRLLDFTVNYSESVTVNTSAGTPAISLTVGSTSRSASYNSGSGTSALVFRYTVQSGETDSDGIASASPVTLNSGMIRDAAGNDAELTFTTPTTTSVLVDTTVPSISSVTGPTDGSYKEGDNLAACRT